MGTYTKSGENLSDLIISARNLFPVIHELTDFLANNSSTYRNEINNHLTWSELLDVVRVVDDHEGYSVILSKDTIRFQTDNARGFGREILKIVAKTNYTATVYADAPAKADPFAAFQTGWLGTGGEKYKRFAEIDKGFKAAISIPAVAELVASLRASSNTFKVNYDDSYVTASELLVSLYQWQSDSVNSKDWTVEIVKGVTRFSKNGNLVCGVQLDPQHKTFYVYAQPVNLDGWTEIPF